ncbi:hypothetical protein V8C86DRAFT_3108367 [Haematococcus lacustris]
MAVLQAELDLVRGQRGSAQAKVQEVQQEAERLGAQRELLTATIEPLEGEVAKLELLLQGVAESASGLQAGLRSGQADYDWR